MSLSCLSCPAFISLPQQRAVWVWGGRTHLFQIKCVPSFAYTYFPGIWIWIEKISLTLWWEDFLSVIRGEGHWTLWLKLPCLSRVTHISKASDFKIGMSRPVSADKSCGCVWKIVLWPFMCTLPCHDKESDKRSLLMGVYLTEETKPGKPCVRIRA